jgi:hypothetical protein
MVMRQGRSERKRMKKYLRHVAGLSGPVTAEILSDNCIQSLLAAPSLQRFHLF